MRLDDGKTATLKSAIVRLYADPFGESLVQETARSACEITQGDYFSFCLYSPRKRGYSLFISNNPPEFIPEYLSVMEKDFLLDSLVTTGRKYIYARDPIGNQREHRDFLEVVQRARPVSDVAYIPCKTRGLLRGYCGLGKAGLRSIPFDDNQLAAFEFLVAFVGDAFNRSLLPPPLEDDLAFLDYRGHLVDAGARVRAAFAELFGRGPIARSGSALYEVFQKRYQNYLHGPFRPGMEKLILFAQERRYSFSFSKLRPRGLELREDGLPYASVRLLGQAEERSSTDPLDLAALSTRYALTPRELEVILGIYRGEMNKEIAAQLGVDESTVKRHTHNIYEKTGFRSRVELVLGLFGEE